MKKIMIYFVFVLTLYLTACAGTGDWTYELPNNYAVCHINSYDIVIKCIDLENHGETIPSFVKEFSYDDRYVYTRNIDDVLDNNILEEKYYLLDTNERKVYGPFDDIKEMQTQANELQCQIPEKWYRTSPDPNMYK